MKKSIFAVLSIWLIAILTSCSDDPSKLIESVQAMRIEPSDCQGCKRCITDLNCPREAISFNKDLSIAVIDPSKCIKCKLCITDFKCPYDAIKKDPDIIAPNAPDLIVLDSTSTNFTIQFWAHDDKNKGYASAYHVKIDTTANFVFTDGKTIYEGDNGQIVIHESLLQLDKTYYFKVVAFDEAGNRSPEAYTKATVISSTRKRPGENVDVKLCQRGKK